MRSFAILLALCLAGCYYVSASGAPYRMLTEPIPERDHEADKAACVSYSEAHGKETQKDADYVGSSMAGYALGGVPGAISAPSQAAYNAAYARCMRDRGYTVTEGAVRP